MLKQLFNFISSLKISIVLLLIFMAAQMLATLGFSTEKESWMYVYGSSWFELIMWLLGLNLISSMVRYKTYKKTSVFIIHISILVILIGAAITRHYGYDGILHLRIGQTKTNFFLTNKKDKIISKPLSFAIHLDNFVVQKYPGSNQPSSYDSYVTVIDKDISFPYHIYMNHILKYKGYRIYQMSYDKDEMGSILFIHKDPGMFITYFGYLLITLGFILVIFDRKSRFFRVIKNTMFIILILSSISNAETIQDWAKQSKTVSSLWSNILVQSNGRIEPMDTLNMDIVHKISRTSNLQNMDYNQIVLGMVAYPELFQSVKMIYVGSKRIRNKLKLKGRYAAYNDFFLPDGSFAFSKEIKKAIYKPPKERDTTDREWLKLNERLYIALSVYEASIFKLFPMAYSIENNNQWYSINELQYINRYTASRYFTIFETLINSTINYDNNKEKETIEQIYNIQKTYSQHILPLKAKIKAEILYNHFNLFTKLTSLYVLFGFIFILMGFVEILKKKSFKKTDKILISLGWIILSLHTLNMIIRWYISGHLPWSNAYESIVFIAWSAAFISLLFFIHNILTLGAGFFIAGMFIMVAHLNSIDPQITNMVPVLKSYWLLIHVAVITIGYGFLAISAMSGLINIPIYLLNYREDAKRINNIIYISIYAGLIFLSIGTLLGGVWANESWGKYWSWDVKETWSLISIIAYAVVLHIKTTIKMDGISFSVLSFFSFFFILMTYFGVNFYIAQGLHSYGRGNAAYVWFYVLKFGIAFWFILVVYLLAKQTFTKFSS